jgi:hypothetical protein
MKEGKLHRPCMEGVPICNGQVENYKQKKKILQNVEILKSK